MLISAGFDFADLTIGLIPGFGTIFDIAGTVLGFFLWGTPGLIQGWEILVPIDWDGLVPTLTIIGLLKIREISD